MADGELLDAVIAVLDDIRDYCPNPFPSEAKLRRLVLDTPFTSSVPEKKR